MSGVLDLNAEKGRLGLDRLLGPYEPENKRHDAESAINRIERAKGTDKLLVISCGYSDSLYPCNLAFCERCKVWASRISKSSLPASTAGNIGTMPSASTCGTSPASSTARIWGIKA